MIPLGSRYVALMAKYVKTDYVPADYDPYLTIGTEYLVIKEKNDGRAATITDDKGYQVLIVYDSCSHLDDRAWTVINR